MKKVSYTNQIKLYLLLFLFSIVVFGVLGIRNGIKGLSQKREVQKEYETILISFAERENLLDKLLTEIQSHEGEIEELDKAIPDKSQEERYLIDLSLQAARAGYALTSFSISKSSATETEVLASLAGDIENINSLVRSIAKLDRLSKIESINAKQEKERGGAVVIAKIKIFNYSNEPE